jgi:single-strand DNA-binding protein
MNRVFLAGNLTRDPEVRYTPSGMAVADLRLAVNERYKDSTTNEWKEKAVYVDVVVWGRQAETSGQYLSKGSPVLIEGRLQLDQWENQQGEKRSKLRVNASRVQFLSGGGGGTQGGGSRPDAGTEFSGTGEEPESGSGSPSRDIPPEAEDDENLPF